MVSAPGADDRSVTVRLDSLGAPDVNNQEYTLGSGRKTISGHSISRVLGAAAENAAWLDLETLPSVEVDRPSGGPVILTRAQALGASDRPPVFYANSGTTVFVMPGSPGREYVFRFTPIGIEVGSEALLELSLAASPRKPRRGQPVTITATVEGAPDGADLRYRWAFSDGGSETTSVPRVTHRFSGKGRRSVVLTVTGSGPPAQAALSLDVAAGDDGNPQGGQDPSMGGDTGTGGAVGGYGAGTAGGFGGGGGGSSGQGSGAAAPSAASPELEASPSPKSRDGLEEVTGTVIDPAASAAAAAPGQPGSDEQSDSGGGPLGLPGEAATLFGVGLLLALGGLIEARVLVRRP